MSVDGQEDGAKRVRIQCVGVGGAGSNSMNRLSEQRLPGIECIAVNTDCMHLAFVDADAKLLIGRGITRGFGARGSVETGRECALEAEEVLCEYVGKGADLVLLSVGLGGGTGTGAAPEVARIAKGNGAQVHAIVTLPFSVESARRQRARDGLEELSREVDGLMVMDNDRLLEVAGDLPVDAAFGLVDEAIAGVVRSIATAALEQGALPFDVETVKAALAPKEDGAAHRSDHRTEHRRPVPATAARAAIASAMVASLWHGGRGSSIIATGEGAPADDQFTIKSVLVGVPNDVDVPPGATGRLVRMGPPGTDTQTRGAATPTPGGPGL
jgi:cell division protein FtsZ